MTPERKALITILENQTRLADIIVNAQQMLRGELQDIANLIGTDANNAIKALRAPQKGVTK